jgi:putative tributyrin esterase
MRLQTNRARIVLLAIFLCLTLTAQPQGASVETVQFQSKLVSATLPYNVILPPDYRASSATRYPVLYLLHGFGGHYSDWVTRTNVADYASQYRMIVVMPEGNDGWYTDSADVATNKYESYFLKELIPDVEKRYRTIQTRYGRGIAGLSMGGYGALKFGLKTPDTFAFAGSLSGTLDVAAWTEDYLKNLKSIRDSVSKVFGPLGSLTRQNNDLFEIVRGISPSRTANLPYFYLDTGTEDFFASNSQQFVLLLREKKIPHEYRELPGEHNWAYWDQQVPGVLQLAAQKMRLPRAVSREMKRPPRRK